MENKLTEIFQKAKLEPGLNMAGDIWRALILRDKRITRFKLWASATILLASLVGLFPVANALLNDLARSGLYEYFSLIFSNGWSVLSYWKELTLSLAESLPTTSIIFTLSLVFVFFLSLRYMVKEIYKNQLMGFITLSV
jgi:hypothetical protein